MKYSFEKRRRKVRRSCCSDCSVPALHCKTAPSNRSASSPHCSTASGDSSASSPAAFSAALRSCSIRQPRLRSDFCLKPATLHRSRRLSRCSSSFSAQLCCRRCNHSKSSSVVQRSHRCCGAVHARLGHSRGVSPGRFWSCLSLCSLLSPHNPSATMLARPPRVFRPPTKGWVWG